MVCVTLVREPLATLVSQAFWSLYTHRRAQQLPWFDEVEPEATDQEFFLRAFRDVHHPNYLNGVFETYFRTEFLDGMGADVLAVPFPHPEGYAVFARDPAVAGTVIGAGSDSLLVLRTDRIEEKLQHALCEASGGLPVPDIHYTSARIEANNKGASNKNKPYYDRFIRVLELSPEEICEIFGRPYARHFLSDAERAQFRDGWNRRTRPS